MAATIKQQIYQTLVTTTITLNSLTNNSYVTGAAAGADATAAEIWGDWVLTLGSLTPTGTPVVKLWLARAPDGTVYEDIPSPPAFDAFAGAFSLTTGAGVKVAVLRDRRLPPGLFRPVVQNVSGVTFAGSGNSLTFRPHSMQSV